MQHLRSFKTPPVGLTKGEKIQLMHLETQGRVQVHMEWNGEWQLGHGKDVPMGMTAVEVGEVMFRFLTDQMSMAEYNETLPV